MFTARATETESPILSLEDVLGFEVSTESATNRAVAAGKAKSITVESRKASAFSLRRPIFQGAMRFLSVQVRTKRAGWISATTVVPDQAKLAPGVFLLDAEIHHVRFPPSIPEELTIEDVEGPVLVRTPFGGHLAGAGFAVAFPRQETLKKAGRVALAEWVALVEKFRNLRSVDAKSFFIVATREYAELAFKLAGQMKITGVIIEEPSHMIFRDPPAQSGQTESGRQRPPPRNPTPPEGTPPLIDEFTAEVAGRYFEYFRILKSPVVLVMARHSIYADFNRSSLLPVLNRVQADFRVVMLEEPARFPRTAKERAAVTTEMRLKEETRIEDPAQAIGYTYEEAGMERWLSRMLQFMEANSATKPEPLPIPDPAEQRRARSRDALRSLGIQPSTDGFDPDSDPSAAGDLTDEPPPDGGGEG